MKAFDRRHFTAFLRALETVDEHDRPTIDPYQRASEQVAEGLSPELGQPVEIQRRGVKEVEQAIIAGVGEAQSAD